MGHTLLSATHWPELSYQTPLTQGEMEGVKPGYDPRGEGASRSGPCLVQFLGVEAESSGKLKPARSIFSRESWVDSPGI